MSLTIRIGQLRQIGEATFTAVDTVTHCALRRHLAAEIDRLIDIMDYLTPDPDAEDDPSEDDAGDDREQDEDREPILGWAETTGQHFSTSRFGDVYVWDEDER